MATVQSLTKQTVGGLSKGRGPEVRVIEKIVDFTNEAAVGATDDLALFTLPKGAVVLAAGIEQLEAGVDATNTFVARVGTVTYSATLTANAAAGTVTAQATSTANLNAILTADTDVNILSATAARTTGKVRVFAVVVESRPVQNPMEVDRDVLA